MLSQTLSLKKWILIKKGILLSTGEVLKREPKNHLSRHHRNHQKTIPWKNLALKQWLWTTTFAHLNFDFDFEWSSFIIFFVGQHLYLHLTCGAVLLKQAVLLAMYFNKVDIFLQLYKSDFTLLLECPSSHLLHCPTARLDKRQAKESTKAPKNLQSVIQMVLDGGEIGDSKTSESPRL